MKKLILQCNRASNGYQNCLLISVQLDISLEKVNMKFEVVWRQNKIIIKTTLRHVHYHNKQLLVLLPVGRVL